MKGSWGIARASRGIVGALRGRRAVSWGHCAGIVGEEVDVVAARG